MDGESGRVISIVILQILQRETEFSNGGRIYIIYIYKNATLIVDMWELGADPAKL